MPSEHEALGEEIAALSAHLDAARSRLIALIGEFDAGEGWADEGCTSCAHWLSWKCGVSPQAAREQVRVARALASLPLTRAAFAGGRVSYSKVRAMTRVATADSEEYLLMLARHGTAAHLERVVRGVRRCHAERELAAANERHEARSFSWWHEDDGGFVAQLRLGAEDGARLVAAVDREMQAVRREREACASAEAPREHEAPRTTYGAMRADALLRLIDGDNLDTEIVVHVSAGTLAAEHESAPDDGCCALEHGPSLPPESARRLACDSGVVPLLEDADGEPLSVGRRTRSIPTAIRRALAARDGGCRFPGCDATARVEGHHVVHWARGGDTALHNLVSLCRRHHRLVHEGGFAVERVAAGSGVAAGGSAFRFLRPDGRAIAHAVPAPAVSGCPREGIEAMNRALGLRIDAGTGVTLWDGVPMDEVMAVEGVLAAGGEPDL